jgi:hypothetical protein
MIRHHQAYRKNLRETFSPGSRVPPEDSIRVVDRRKSVAHNTVDDLKPEE